MTADMRPSIYRCADLHVHADETRIRGQSGGQRLDAAAEDAIDAAPMDLTLDAKLDGALEVAALAESALPIRAHSRSRGDAVLGDQRSAQAGLFVVGQRTVEEDGGGHAQVRAPAAVST